MAPIENDQYRKALEDNSIDDAFREIIAISGGRGDQLLEFLEFVVQEKYNELFSNHSFDLNIDDFSIFRGADVGPMLDFAGNNSISIHTDFEPFLIKVIDSGDLTSAEEVFQYLLAVAADGHNFDYAYDLSFIAEVIERLKEKYSKLNPSIISWLNGLVESSEALSEYLSEKHEEELQLKKRRDQINAFESTPKEAIEFKSHQIIVKKSSITPGIQAQDLFTSLMINYAPTEIGDYLFFKHDHFHPTPGTFERYGLNLNADFYLSKTPGTMMEVWEHPDGPVKILIKN